MGSNSDYEWDAFISHAVEDQASFVRPLSKSLTQLGVRVWYSETSLKLGDSLSRSIDKGLAESRHGVVVLSHDFFRKQWPERELQGLVMKDIERPGTILPIWHGVDRSDVMKFSPPLADKIAIRTSDATVEEIALQILSVVRPDIYGHTDHRDLEQLAKSGSNAKIESPADLQYKNLVGTSWRVHEAGAQHKLLVRLHSFNQFEWMVDRWISKATGSLHGGIWEGYGERQIMLNLGESESGESMILRGTVESGRIIGGNWYAELYQW